MKSYKQFEKRCIGESDIARLIFRSVSKTIDVGTGMDGAYKAYIVTEPNVEIGGHYEEILSCQRWLCVYDDTGRTVHIKADDIRIFQASSTFIIQHWDKVAAD